MKSINELGISPAPWTNKIKSPNMSSVWSANGFDLLSGWYARSLHDTRLIAAAPELYEALRKIMETFCDVFDPDCLTQKEMSVVNMANVTLEKAGGVE